MYLAMFRMQRFEAGAITLRGLSPMVHRLIVIVYLLQDQCVVFLTPIITVLRPIHPSRRRPKKDARLPLKVQLAVNRFGSMAKRDISTCDWRYRGPMKVLEWSMVG